MNMKTTCYYYDILELADPARFAQGMASLPWDERKEKILRYRFEKDRLLSLGAALLAADVLRRAGAEDLRICHGKYGKPELLNHPEIQFNLSHSGRLAVCAVSGNVVGVDVETPTRLNWDVARRCFQTRELEWMSQSAEQEIAFTRLWTRKESYIKLLGTGLSCELASFSVLPGEEVEGGAVFTEKTVPGHMICVCTYGQTADITEWRNCLR